MQSAQMLFRVARRIHATYEQLRVQREKEQQAGWYHLQERFEQVQQQHIIGEKARSRGWHLAAEWHRVRFCSAMRAVQEAARQAHESFRSTQPNPSLTDLFAELQHLEMEFDNVTIDPKKSFLSVETQRIVLEDINLGRFSLRLHWPRLVTQANVTCVEIVALNPNTAGDDEDVPHPHVRDGQLCAGEATLPLRKALEEGRLIDAFHLILGVLETYNPDSAYVRLDQWNGFSCWSCSSSSDRDESYFCEACHHDVCNDCVSSCKECDAMRCTSCQARCDVCNEPCCRNCLTTSACSDVACCKDCLRPCAGCNAEVAPEELDEKTKHCSACRDKPVTAEAAEDSELVPASTLEGDSR